MASYIPSLTNENFHMYEPSPIETSLANNVSSLQPGAAFPLLMAYRGQNQANNQAYQSQLDQMHQIQQQEANTNQGNAAAVRFDTTLKDMTQPGQLLLAKQMGLIPQDADTSELSSNLTANNSAKNMGEAGRGIGSAAMGGITGLAPAAQATFGSDAGQGPAPLVQAASINAAGRVAAAGANNVPKITMPYGDIGPNQGTITFKAPGTMPTSLPQANASSMSQPAAPTADSVPAMQQAITRNLPSVAAVNPASHADILAGAVNGKPNVVFDAGHNTYVVQGKNNQYPVAPFLK